jgi:hypothetical protein
MTSSRGARLGASVLLSLVLIAGLTSAAFAASPADPAAGSSAAPTVAATPSPTTAQQVGPSTQTNAGGVAPATTGWSVQGTIFAPGGVTPLGNILINVESLTVSLDVFTASDGTYSVDNVPAGTYAVKVIDSGGTYLTGWYDTGAGGNFTLTQGSATPVTVTSANVTGINVTMHTGHFIRGTVTGTGGTPLGGIVVHASSSITGYFSFVWSASNGTYAIDVPDSGSYTIEFTDIGLKYLDGFYGYYNGTYTVAVDSTLATTVAVGTSDVSGISARMLQFGTYVPVTPVRVLDTRNGTGLSGKITANTPATFGVTGTHVPTNAMAVTGNVTVVNSSNSWALYLGPDPIASPTTSTINFATGQITGNGLTVALSGTGTLSATYMSSAGNTTDLVFDVTGYFLPDMTGATYHAMTPPSRLLDTRVGKGLSSKLLANTPATFPVAGVSGSGIPSNATAVTANVTVVNPTFSWAVYLGPVATATPTTSTINFNAGEIKGNSLTVQLGAGGTLSATFMSSAGNTTDLVLDVTGYYTADTTGAVFVPIAPARLLDTRVANGLATKLSANTPATFQVTGRGGIPSSAAAVTGNVTVVNETNSWAVFLGPDPVASPSTSTINFVTGDIKGNGLTVAPSVTGTLSATYMSNAGNTTDLVFDVTGYFVPAP